MNIGKFYFDEKDILLVIAMAVLIFFQLTHAEVILFFTVTKLFLVIFLSFLARVFYGKTREAAVFCILFFGILISNILSYPGLSFFMIFSFVLTYYLFKS